MAGAPDPGEKRHGPGWALVVEHALGGRLAAGEQLLLAWPRLFRGVLERVALAVRAHPRLLIAVGWFGPGFGPEHEARLLFWAQQAQASAFALDSLSKRELAHFLARTTSAGHRVEGLSPEALPRELQRMLAEVSGRGEPGAGPRSHLELSLTLGRTPTEPSWDAGDSRLHVPAQILPPLGERLSLRLTIPPGPAAHELEARVSEVQGASARSTGRPRGYRLSLVEPTPEVLEALARWKAAEPTPAPPAAPGAERRSSPRFRLHAPVHLEPVQAIRMEYESGRAFADEWIENLSLGGAFVRTARPLPMHSKVVLDIRLPGRALPPVPAVVVRLLPQGMGVQFQPDARIRSALEEALEQLSQRAWRALVSIESPDTRAWAEAALRGRGFETRSAPDAASALHILLEDAPWLDLLVVDAGMTGGEEGSLVGAVRGPGGETDLAIAVLTDHGARTLAGARASLGLDLVAEQGVGGALFAARAEEAIERRQRGEAGAPEVLELAAEPVGPQLILRYPDALALAADAEVLRLGGAFVPTTAPMTLGEEVQLALMLPGGVQLNASAVVVSVEARGVGLQFELSAAEGPALTAALALVSTPPPPAPVHAPHVRLLLDEEPSAIHGPKVGPFTLLSLLGRGGVAEVHFARANTGPLAGRHVALKQLLPHIARDARFVELFAGEADVTRMLDHPHLVRTLAVGLNGELPWMAMEVVDGCDLSQVLDRARRRGTPLSVGFAVGVVGPLLEALDYAHRAVGLSGEPLQLVHCDISPSNVFVTRKGVVKLGDFGVARRRGVTSEIAGKAHYLSPQGLEGQVDPGLDLWAVAVILYELLTLQRPFDGPDTPAVLTAVRKRRHVPLRKLRPELPRELQTFLERAFAAKPHQRFVTAGAMREALTPWLQEPSGRPEALAERVGQLLATER